MQKVGLSTGQLTGLLQEVTGVEQKAGRVPFRLKKTQDM